MCTTSVRRLARDPATVISSSCRSRSCARIDSFEFRDLVLVSRSRCDQAAQTQDHHNSEQEDRLDWLCSFLQSLTDGCSTLGQIGGRSLSVAITNSQRDGALFRDEFETTERTDWHDPLIGRATWRQVARRSRIGAADPLVDRCCSRSGTAPECGSLAAPGEPEVPEPSIEPERGLLRVNQPRSAACSP